ncbi:beta-1,3-galactosyltransferase 2-like [Discoglossus pictus]
MANFWCLSKISILILICFCGLFFLFEYKTYQMANQNKLQTEEIPTLKPPFRHPLAPPYPYPYKFIINQPEKCQNRIPFLVILVVGTCCDVATRIAIRKTWGNESNYEDVAVATIFLVGMSPIATDAAQKLLEEENALYGDIVQQDFLDTYYNLTLKSLMGMEWVAKYCPSASYVMKIDNDMFLNVEYLVHHVLRPKLPVHNNYFSGYIVSNTGPLRSKAYKWYVPKEVYPNDTYPPYCAGPGYVFSADMARKIYDVAQVIRVVPMEDSFMGICLYELHIKPTEPSGAYFNGHRIDYNICKFKSLVTVHHYGKDELMKIWPDFWANRKTKCKK